MCPHSDKIYSHGCHQPPETGLLNILLLLPPESRGTYLLSWGMRCTAWRSDSPLTPWKGCKIFGLQRDEPLAGLKTRFQSEERQLGLRLCYCSMSPHFHRASIPTWVPTHCLSSTQWWHSRSWLTQGERKAVTLAVPRSPEHNCHLHTKRRHAIYCHYVTVWSADSQASYPNRRTN